MKTSRLQSTFLLIGVALLAPLSACRKGTTTFLTASGTTEVLQTDVAALAPARILQLLVDEGDSVQPGDTLVRLTQSTLSADIDLRRARVAAAEAAVRDLEAGARPQEIGRLEAELAAAEAEVQRTSRDFERATALFKAQAFSQSQVDAARTAAATAASRRDGILQSISLLKAGSREERILAARAEVAAARAALNAALAVSSDLVLTAPAPGIVLARHVEAGEVIAAGVPAFTLGDVNKPWVRVFVAAPALTKLRVGQEALAAVQGMSDELFAARIVAIDSRAQFTPRIALTEDERADLMFGVKVELAQHAQAIKPGLPIDVHFDTSGAGFPASLTNGRTIHRLAGVNGGG